MSALPPKADTCTSLLNSQRMDRTNIPLRAIFENAMTFLATGIGGLGLLG